VKTRFLALALSSVLVIAGCTGQQTAADLIAIVGTAVEALVTQSGGTVPTQLPTDLSAAETLVKNWKSGTPTAEVNEALNLLVADINLIPVSAKDKAYISLAVGTTEQIIALFPPAPTPGATAQISVMRVPKRMPSKTPVTDFKEQWNALAASGSTDSKLFLK
jgi:hypothetical protein